MFEEKFLEPHFTSVLAPYMLDVVEQKRALGNKYNAGVEALSAFDDFCNEQQLRIPAISKELLRMCEFFVSICTAMAMMLHVHSTLRLM